MHNLSPIFPKYLFFCLILSLLLGSNAFAKLQMPADTIVLVNVKQKDGYKEGTTALFVGSGAMVLTFFNSLLALTDVAKDAYVLYSLGIAAGLAAIVTGIVGLVKSSKARRRGKMGTDRVRLAKATKRSVGGILFGIGGILLSVLLILAQSGVIGF